MAEMPSIVLCNSGGLDTLVVAKILFNQGYKIYSVHCDFGQQNRERVKTAMEYIADKYCELGKEIVFARSDVRDSFATTKMLKDGSNSRLRVPYTGTFFPFIAGMIAHNLEIDYLAVGIKSDVDHPISRYKKVIGDIIGDPSIEKGNVILFPIGHYETMDEVVERGLLEGLTIEEMNQTVSCNQEITCGLCRKCRDRLRLGITLR